MARTKQIQRKARSPTREEVEEAWNRAQQQQVAQAAQTGGSGAGPSGVAPAPFNITPMAVHPAPASAPAPPAVPLPFEQREKLAKKIHSRLFKNQKWDWNGRQVNGYQIIKELLLKYGYKLSPDKRRLIPLRPDLHPEIPLNGVNGLMTELNFTKLPFEVEQEMWRIFFLPTLERKRVAALKASSQRMVNRQAEAAGRFALEVDRTNRQLEDVRKERARLMMEQNPDNPYYATWYDALVNPPPPSPPSPPSASSRTPSSMSGSGTPGSGSYGSRTPSSGSYMSGSGSYMSGSGTPGSGSYGSRTSSSGSYMSGSGTPGSGSSYSSSPGGVYSVINSATGLAEKRPRYPQTPSSGGSSSSSHQSPTYEVVYNEQTGRSEKRPLRPQTPSSRSSSVPSPAGSPGYVVVFNERTGLAEKRPTQPQSPESDWSVTAMSTDSERGSPGSPGRRRRSRSRRNSRRNSRR